MTHTPDPQPLAGVTPEAFAGDIFDDWLATGTISRREVTIYADVETGQRLAAISDRLTEITPTDTDGESPADGPLDDGTATERAQLEAEAEELLERLAASKSVWVVRALSQDEVEATFDADAGGVPLPKTPIAPPPNANDKIRERYAERVRRFGEEKRKSDQERVLVQIARAVESVTTEKGTVDGVTVERLRALRARPHGQQWIDRLHEAVQAATQTDVEPPRPTSPGRSTSDLG